MSESKVKSSAVFMGIKRFRPLNKCISRECKFVNIIIPWKNAILIPLFPMQGTKTHRNYPAHPELSIPVFKPM